MSKPTDQHLLEAAAEAVKKAYAPYSNYPVGAAVKCADDGVFSGCNVENASYGLTVCAERSALFAAVSAGHTAFHAMAVVAEGNAFPYPCGACRQVMAEFGRPESRILVARSSDLKGFKEYRLGDLLPHAFRI
jgi:cytidine deaminase